jgi:serine/threonine protein kinase
MKTCPQCDSGYPDSQTTCPIHGVLLNEIRDLKPGMVIRNTYRIVRKLGQGGMGAVYLAQHTLMNEPQALKFLSSELSQDEAFTARFLREVRTLRQIRHKNVVDAGNLEPAEDGTLFFSMEFVDGPDLRSFLQNMPQPFDVRLALSITRGIAEGLGAAHAKGMVHRDIKPENILMARDGDCWVPKIVDFGIVATKENSSVYTKTGGTLLTMAYAAPEQWRGTPAAELDGRTDLYALGGLLYEMLTSQTPFHAENYEGWAEQHRYAAPQSPSTHRPDLANWQCLDALVLRLLAKDREDRPKDVAELLGLLDAVRLIPSEARRETVKDETASAYIPKSVLGSPRSGIIKWAIVAVIVLVLGIWLAARFLTSTPAPVVPALTPGRVINTDAFTWTDPATGLMWTKKDNNSDVNWQQATDYCRNLDLAGHSDWRLPTIDELQGIYDPNANVGGYHVKGNLQLSNLWDWSSSQGNASGEAWNFRFDDGWRHPFHLGFSFITRALCVRGPVNHSNSTETKPAPVVTAIISGSAKAEAMIWTDPATGLMWTKKDNGSDVNWQQAIDYCRNLQLASHSDWRLPTIDELQGIYDSNINIPGYCCGVAETWHVKGKLQVSGWEWSRSKGNASGEAWDFSFADWGVRNSYQHGLSDYARALCVRRSRE